MLTSKELYDRIEQLRIQKGLSVAKLNELAGISHGTLNSWKIRGTTPKLEVLKGLCNALEISLTALLYDVRTDKFTGEETELLSYWKELDEEQRQAVISVIKVMAKK